VGLASCSEGRTRGWGDEESALEGRPYLDTVVELLRLGDLLEVVGFGRVVQTEVANCVVKIKEPTRKSCDGVGVGNSARFV